jgi:hypothetical protein
MCSSLPTQSRVKIETSAVITVHLMPGKIKRALQISVLLFAILLAVIGFGLVPVNLFFA